MPTLRKLAAFTLFFAAIVAVSPVEANNSGTMINVDYSLATPLGQARTYTPGLSGQGIGMEARFYGNRLTGGIGISWQVFHDEKEAPGTLSGAQYETWTTSLLPLMASGYYLWNHGKIRTIIGGGVGGMLERRTLAAQAEETTEKTWYMAASGLAGAFYEMSPAFGLEAKLRYVGGFKGGIKPLGMVQATIGITFLY